MEPMMRARLISVLLLQSASAAIHALEWAERQRMDTRLLWLAQQPERAG